MTDAVWWRVAWRNLGRNRGRTLVTASGLAFGYLAAVVLIGLTDGMMSELIENGTRLLIGQVQIHADDYRPERSMYRTIGGSEGIDVDALLSRLEADADVTAAAPRLYAGGLLSAHEETQAVLLLGVDAAREHRVSTLLGNVTDGRIPGPEANELLVGTELADKLSLSVGDEIVLVAPAADGSLGNDLYTLAGIFDTGTPAIDGNYAILPLADLQFLMVMEPSRIHEVVMTVPRPWETPEIATALGERLAPQWPNLAVEPWTELRPELYEGVLLADSMNFVVVVIIFAMVIFGVANTMLIGTFERRREFAVVRALGTTPGAISRSVVYEGVILGALSLTAGVLITIPVLVWFHDAPPDLSSVVGGFSWSGAQWRPILRVEYSIDAPIVSGIALFLTSVFAAVYPAWKATRVPPADALADR
jgi:putative ABC transport system permease protein